MRLPEGFRAGAAAAGVKPSGRPDVGLIVSDRPATAAALFTANRVVAAPVILSRRHARRGAARAIVVNSGNANACTGAQGLEDAREMAARTAALARTKEQQVLVASTGIIGHALPMDRVRAGIEAAHAALSPDGLAAVAEAILTTDTVAKYAEASAGGARIAGVAKGSGMMAPEMATMLVFLATDAAVDRKVLSEALRAASAASFESLSLDGCGSTNDTVFALANGAAGAPAVAGEDAVAAFTAALGEVCGSLAYQLAADGEGATKVVTLRVRGATDPREARKAVRSLANSVLLRCAINGADPNWGRALAAIGASGIPLDPARIDLWMGGEKMCEGGARGPGDAAKAAAALRERDVEIVLDLGRGPSESTMLTNDLSVEYVRINAEYTT